MCVEGNFTENRTDGSGIPTCLPVMAARVQTNVIVAPAMSLKSVVGLSSMHHHKSRYFGIDYDHLRRGLRVVKMADLAVRSSSAAVGAACIFARYAFLLACVTYPCLPGRREIVNQTTFFRSILFAAVACCRFCSLAHVRHPLLCHSRTTYLPDNRQGETFAVARRCREIGRCLAHFRSATSSGLCRSPQSRSLGISVERFISASSFEDCVSWIPPLDLLFRASRLLTGASMKIRRDCREHDHSLQALDGVEKPDPIGASAEIHWRGSRTCGADLSICASARKKVAA